MKDIIEYFDFFCGWIFLWLISASLLSAVATGVIMLAKRIVAWKREKQSTPPKTKSTLHRKVVYNTKYFII